VEAFSAWCLADIADSFDVVSARAPRWPSLLVVLIRADVS
jgi:hypothetical protein